MKPLWEPAQDSIIVFLDTSNGATRLDSPQPGVSYLHFPCFAFRLQRTLPCPACQS
jgi:hypothetical protein